MVGEPLGIRKLYNYTGINPTTGVYRFEDVNKDGAYNLDDRQTVRFVGPDYFGGLQNSFQFKGFQFDFLFQFVKQTGSNYFSMFDTPGIVGSEPSLVLDRWKQEGDQAPTQRFGTTGEPVAAYSRFLTSQQSVGDASFIRLKNLSLSYVLSQKWIEKMKMDNVRIFIQGQNLMTITNYRGLDPETQGSLLPPLRVITIGIHLTF